MPWKPEWMRGKIRVFEDRPIPFGGAIDRGIDIGTVQVSNYVEMELIMYSSWYPVHGLFCVDRATFSGIDMDPKIMHLFFGYMCEDCKKVFLIADTVKTDFDLYRLLKHVCRTKGLHEAH